MIERMVVFGVEFLHISFLPYEYYFYVRLTTQATYIDSHSGN